MRDETNLATMTFLLLAFALAALRVRRRPASAARTRLGRYTLGERIGAGAMGTVYKASHDLLARPAAVKVLPADADPQAAARFEREVQTTSRLTHPNTVAVYDFGRAEDGTAYYAMEYLDGVDLQTLVEREGPLPPARVAHLLAQAASALDEAHRAGLLHRDVKPGNLMVCERGGSPDVLKVIDFGLVEEVSSAAGRDGHRIVGTPLYLSPEAILAPDRIDARSDLYGLGAVGYFLLTGVPPFSGRNLFEVCRHQVESDPVAPSRRIGAPLPAALEALVLACLAKQPDERPASAAALRDALEPLAAAWMDDLARGPTKTGDPAAPKRDDRSVNRCAAALVSTVIAACGGSGDAPRDGGSPADGAAPDAEAGPPAVCQVAIDCGGADIPDEPKIACAIEIGDGLGAIVHQGRIGIERRGRSSLGFPKAQYSVELRTEADAELAVDLFSMGRESDWILNGMYIDRALLRNKLFFDLFQSLGGPERYAPETRYCELVLDGDYRGIYLLTEKVKRDDDRIALADDGGAGASFIVKQDEAGFREIGVANGSWQLVYPNDLTATQPQIDGVGAWLDGWRQAVEGTSDVDLFTLMDLDSAVDFVLLQELAKGNDAYFLSMHVWKDVGGRLHFTPWDLDLSLGQPLYNDSTLTTGWVVYRPALIQALADDPRFQARLAERWTELRAGAFAAAALEERIQLYLATIGDRIDENFARWPIEEIQFLGSELPPRASFEEEMAAVRSWIDGRLGWVDAHVAEYAAGN